MSSSASRAVGIALAAPLLITGCSSPSESAGTTIPAGSEGPITLAAPDRIPPSAPLATDLIADLGVDAQTGDGSEVAVTSVALSREPALLVITDKKGRIRGEQRVSTRSQPVQIRLQSPVTRSQELVAALYLDDGDGALNPPDIPMVDDEDEPVREYFDYVVQ